LVIYGNKGNILIKALRYIDVGKTVVGIRAVSEIIYGERICDD
jgi:hypothetical protein